MIGYWENNWLIEGKKISEIHVWRVLWISITFRLILGLVYHTHFFSLSDNCLFILWYIYIYTPPFVGSLTSPQSHNLNVVKIYVRRFWWAKILLTYHFTIKRLDITINYEVCRMPIVSARHSLVPPPIL